MLKKLFSEFEWHPWRFKVSPRGVFRDEATLGLAVGFVEKSLHFQSLDEYNFSSSTSFLLLLLLLFYPLPSCSSWHRVTRAQLRELGVEQMFKVNGGLATVLHRHYPDHPWDSSLLLPLSAPTTAKRNSTTIGKRSDRDRNKEGSAVV